MDKQRAIIILLVSIMVFSVIGFTLILILDDGSSPNQQQQDIAELQEEFEAQQEAERLAEEQAEEIVAQCAPIPSSGSAQALDLPEVFIPDGDVTELGQTDLVVGDGAEVQPGDCIVAHYHGTLATDGSVFDSSYERGEPARFPLTGVIGGWQEGVPGMKEGGVRRLVIPSELAYGVNGSPPIIGPNADLVFVVEVVRVE